MTLTLENVGLYAETLVRQASARGQTLDYSPESLAVLDALLAVSDPQLEETSTQQRDLVIFYTGCYLGEVLVRTLGAQWQLTEDWAEATLVLVADANKGGIEVRPFEKLHRRLTEGPEGNSLRAYGEGLKERFDALSALAAAQGQ
ncbi:DUF6278 family protein [Armatimonas sp.]|uniref:DUF6278 family protein n=1 Tax=Armatimonas sp. TaxID=1872638 RepID=UPI00286AD083|nr:DUF6278 family protein [Armatimonas sp.]